jgi:hypothetical protein
LMRGHMKLALPTPRSSIAIVCALG